MLFLLVEHKVVNIERMIVIENHSFATIKIKTSSGKKSLYEEQDFLSNFKVSPHKLLNEYKRKMVTIQWRNWTAA